MYIFLTKNIPKYDRRKTKIYSLKKFDKFEKIVENRDRTKKMKFSDFFVLDSENDDYYFCPQTSELLLGGRTLTANEALRAGLVTRVLWPDRFKDELLPSLRAMSEQSSQVKKF